MKTITAITVLFFFNLADALVPQIQRSAINNPKTTSQHESLQSRRGALRYAFLLAPSIAATAIPSPGSPANALELCRPKSHNCIRTTWTAPASLTTSLGVTNAIRDVLNSYPQKGQSGVDCNGWKIVNDALDAEAGMIKLEFKSCVGPAALAINLGQPFIDDCKLELGKDSAGNITVEVKSSSRMGASDLFVNRKRLQYLSKKLKQDGWSIPDPKYVYEM